MLMLISKKNYSKKNKKKSKQIKFNKRIKSIKVRKSRHLKKSIKVRKSKHLKKSKKYKKYKKLIQGGGSISEELNFGDFLYPAITRDGIPLKDNECGVLELKNANDKCLSNWRSLILKYKISFLRANAIASGNFGDVYLALNNEQQPIIKYRFNRRIINNKQIKRFIEDKKNYVAIKTFKVPKNAEADKKKIMIAEVQNEIYIMKIVNNNNNIVSFYGTINSHNTLKYIVMEYCFGGSLLNMLKNKTINKLNDKVTVIKNICHGVALGLTVIQEKRIIHIDLAARNILITTDNSNRYIPKIGDFGLAQQLETAERNYSLKDTEFSLQWIDPQVFFTKKYNIYSDIWSYGCILVEILQEGLAPWRANSWNIENADPIYLNTKIINTFTARNTINVEAKESQIMANREQNEYPNATINDINNINNTDGVIDGKQWEMLKEICCQLPLDNPLIPYEPYDIDLNELQKYCPALYSLLNTLFTCKIPQFIIQTVQLKEAGLTFDRDSSSENAQRCYNALIMEDAKRKDIFDKIKQYFSLSNTDDLNKILNIIYKKSDGGDPPANPNNGGTIDSDGLYRVIYNE